MTKVFSVQWGGYTWQANYGIFSTREKALICAIKALEKLKQPPSMLESDDMPTPDRMIWEIELDKEDIIDE